MALYKQCSLVKKTLPLSYIFLKFMSNTVSNKVIILEADAFDDFTTQLVQKQSSKWEAIQAKSTQVTEQSAGFKQNINNVVNNKHKLDENKIEKLMKNAVEKDDVHQITNLIDMSIKCGYSPTRFLLLSMLPICSQRGKYETICKIKTICDNNYEQVLQQNANFNHYLAEALWVQGSVCKSLDLFKLVYEENHHLRQNVTTMLKNLILCTSLNHGEAVMFKILKFCEHLHESFTDSCLLGVVWQMCFLSEWYADQCKALEILEKNEKLCNSIVNRFPFVVKSALMNHQTEIVYKLLEFLLKRGWRAEYSNVLQCLFDYKCKSIMHFYGYF